MAVYKSLWRTPRSPDLSPNTSTLLKVSVWRVWVQILLEFRFLSLIQEKDWDCKFSDNLWRQRWVFLCVCEKNNSIFCFWATPISQPVFIGELFQPCDQLSVFPPDLCQQVSGVGGPELDTQFQMGSHKKGVEGREPSPLTHDSFSATIQSHYSID